MGKLLWVLSLFFILANSLFAHEYWLEADKSQVIAGEANTIKLMFGENFSNRVEKPLQLDRAIEFRAHGLSRKFDNLLPKTEKSVQPAATIELKQEGTILVSLIRSASVIRFGKAKFLEYAQQEGGTNFEQALAVDKVRITDTYTRYMKALFQVGNLVNKTALKKVGMEYEIIPLENPFSKELKELNVKVLFRGKPAAGVKVNAIKRLDNILTSESAISDQKGRCKFPLDQKGSWLIRSVKIIPDANNEGPTANFHSYWASLTFGY